MNKAYKVRLYPNKEQEVLINKTFGCVRVVWNTLLAKNIKGYQENPEGYKLLFNSTPLKSEFDFLSEVSAAALQQKGRDLKETYSQFFNKKRKVKSGFPKFKSKHKSKASFRLPNQKFGIFQENNSVRLEKIGKVLCKYASEIPKEAKLISITVSKSGGGKYFASVVVDQEITPLHKTSKKIGIDIGIKDLMTLSNGVVIKNPRFLRENQSKIKKVQRHLSRKTKGSTRYTKCKKKLAKLHEEVSNQRSWYLHNITKALVKAYDLISVETLSSESMKSKHKNINSSIYDTSIYELTRQLEYKCHWYGKSFIKVDKWFPSSQLCCECGTQNKEIKNLNIRDWQCVCGANHHRDVNAAKNILKQGFKDLSGESLDYRREDFVDTFNYVKELDNFIETLTIL